MCERDIQRKMTTDMRAIKTYFDNSVSESDKKIDKD